MLGKFRLQERLEWLTVSLGKTNWGCHVEIMQEVCDVEQDRMAGLCNTEQLDSRLGIEQPFFCLYLLKCDLLTLVMLTNQFRS